MESMLPAVTPKKRLGLPKRAKSAFEVQSGWATIPTRNPWASSRRPMMAMPKLGWST